MEIKTDLIISPKFGKQKYAKYLGVKEVAYTIDYEVNKKGDVCSSFTFNMKN